MALNWAISVYVFFITSAVWISVFLLSIRSYHKKKYQYFLLISFSLLFNGISTLFRALATLLESSTLGLISVYILIPGTIMIIALEEIIMRDSIRSVTIVCLTTLSTMVIYATFHPNIITFLALADGTKYLLENILLAAPIMLFMFLNVIIGIEALHELFKKTPKSLKKYPRIILLALFISVPTVAGFFLFYYSIFITSGSMWLISAIGIGIIILSFAIEPKLAFILNMNIYKLTIINTNSGILLYNHNFKRSDQTIDDDLFSGMMQGINTILNEAVNKGELVEMKLSNAIMIVERTEKYPVACVLTTSKSSLMLRKSLQIFFQQFINTFDKQLLSEARVDQFEKVVELIHQYFAFIPDYD